MPASEILADLVRFPSLPATPNMAITGHIRDYLAALGIDCTLIPVPGSDRYNLFATIGPPDIPGYILSGHTDVVATEGQNWTSDPFILTERDGRLFGRGATDMKGFLACALTMVPRFQALPLRHPIHLAFSCDEEIGCQGVGPMIDRLPELCAPPLGAIIGEPSSLRPVLAHKGKCALMLEIEGVAGHSSEPDKGENALYPAAVLLLFIADLNRRLAAEGPFDPHFSPPNSTCQAGVMQGGMAVNIIPERATIQFELRSIPGALPSALSQPVISRLKKLEAAAQARGAHLKVHWQEMSSYPALPSCEDTDFVTLIEEVSGKSALASVNFGTEAGLYHQAGIPAIICGPGNIAQAHRPDEFILRSELDRCCAMLERLAQKLCA